MSNHDTEMKKEDMISLAMPDGTMAGGVEVDYELKGEPWTVVELSDGTVLKIRPMLAKIFRLDRYHPMNGEPLYFIQSQPQILAKVPANLKRKPKPSKPGQEFA